MSHVLIAEGIEEAGKKILEAAGLNTVSPKDTFNPADVHALIVRSVFQVKGDALKRFPNLRVVAKLGTGIDNIDQKACEEKRVAVFNAPGMNAISTAEFIVMQTLALWKNAYEIHHRVEEQDYRRATYYGHELAGVHVGIIGCGSVGGAVAKRLLPSVKTVSTLDPFCDDPCPGITKATDLNTLLPDCDIVILTVTLKGNEKMVDQAFLANVKPNVLLINAARGKLIDEDVCVPWLKTHPEARYVCDVIDPEPNYTLAPEQQTFKHPLLDLPNVYFTPHIASLTPECQENLSIYIAQKVVDDLNSKGV